MKVKKESILGKHFLYFFCCPYDTLKDKLGDDDSSFDDIFIDTPEPSRIDHLYAACLCGKYIFCMKKPLSPMFWIVAGPSIWYFTSLYVENESDYREEIDLLEFFFFEVFYFFIRKSYARNKFLNDVRRILVFIFF